MIETFLHWYRILEKNNLDTHLSIQWLFLLVILGNCKLGWWDCVGKSQKQKYKLNIQNVLNIYFLTTKMETVNLHPSSSKPMKKNGIM